MYYYELGNVTGIPNKWVQGLGKNKCRDALTARADTLLKEWN